MHSSVLHFSNSFYDAVARSQKNSFRNTCISPYSIYTALACTMCGADGHTKTELANVLKLEPGSSITQSFAKSLQNVVDCQSGVDVKLANRMFLHNSANIHDSFVNDLRNMFASEPQKVDFARQPEAARSEINSWVQKTTSNKVKELLPQGSVDSDTKLVLGNAIYFQGSWQVPFLPSATVEQDFQILGGGTKKAHMMSMNGHIHIEEYIVNDAAAIKLPFKDPRFELLVMLPKSNDEFPAFVEAISQEGALKKVLNSEFYDQETQLKLPRFKLSMTPSLDVISALGTMGVQTLFSHPNLSNISNDPLKVSNIAHQAVLEVDELGATGAAGTGVCISRRGLLRPIEFIADHAFVVAVIVDKTVPLFLGHVIVPE